MPILRQLTAIMQIVMIVLLAIVAVAVLIIFWFKKVKKPSNTEEDVTNYSNLKREDSIDYVKFDYIDDDMIVTNKGTEFHGIIQCMGFNYYSSNPSEQKRAHDGYLSFINVINDDHIVYRQYTKTVDLEDMLADYQKAFDRIEGELFFASQDFDNIQAEYNNERAKVMSLNTTMDEQMELIYLNELNALNEKMTILDWQRQHVKDNIQYAKMVCDHTAPERVETYIFSWKYDPLVGAELTDEQIYQKAIRELDRMANTYIHALSNAGVSAVRVKTMQLRQMYRRHFHPYTSNMYKAYEVEASNFYTDVTTAPAFTEADYAYAEQAGTLDEVYAAQDKLRREGKPADSLPYDKLLAYGRGEDEDNNRLSGEEISIRAEEVTNRFKKMEEKREKEKSKKHRKKTSDEQQQWNTIDFSSSFDFKE